VYAALAWIWDNREQVLADLAQEQLVSAEMQARYPSKLQAKLAGVHGAAISS
jgi:hypothetical protein